jgi:hypothetical protein
MARLKSLTLTMTCENMGYLLSVRRAHQPNGGHHIHHLLTLFCGIATFNRRHPQLARSAHIGGGWIEPA